MDDLIKSLRARRLDRIAVGYAVAGWIVVQAASIALPTFEAPAWILRAIIIFVLLGFPIGLTLGWFAAPRLFDTDLHRRPLGRTHATLAVFGVIIVVIVANLAYLLSSAPRTSPAFSVASASLVAKNSIAVLPFVNMSGDPAKEYFSDGISEELLNDLANIPELVVAARTSSFAFKGKNENIKDIARVLAVRSVLEGSVRESGNHLRVTAQLINAADGYHLWSAMYDRNLTDVLVVQDQIAQAITSSLTHRLLPRPILSKPVAPRAIDPNAYRTYLQGKHELGPRTQTGSEAALVLFKKVTQLAPDFAEGFAALALAQLNVAEYRPERNDLIPAAQDALVRALTLDPDNLSALRSHLELSLHKSDWPAAIDDARRMKGINPNSAQVLHEMFRFYLFLGFPDLAFAAASGAVKLDPLSLVDRLNVTTSLLHNERYQEAQAAARTALTLKSDQPLILSLQCAAAALGHDVSLARSVETRLVASGDASDIQFCRFRIAIAEGHGADARTILDKFAQTFMRGGPSATELAELYAIVGDNKKTVEWLQRAYDAKEFWLVLFVNWKTVPPAFFESAEWKAFYRQPLFDQWRRAHDLVAADIAARK